MGKIVAGLEGFICLANIRSQRAAEMTTEIQIPSWPRPGRLCCSSQHVAWLSLIPYSQDPWRGVHSCFKSRINHMRN